MALRLISLDSTCRHCSPSTSSQSPANPKLSGEVRAGLSFWVPLNRQWGHRGEKPNGRPASGHAGGLKRRDGRSRCSASVGGSGGGSPGDVGGRAEDAGEADEVAAARRRLAQSFQNPSSRITGGQIRELVMAKYGRSYDVRLAKINNRVYLQIMWRHLEQRSFPLTEEMYMDQLDAVAEFLNIWGVVDKVRDMIRSTKHRPGYTGGGGAKAVSLPLDIGRGAGRGQEWMDHF